MNACLTIPRHQIVCASLLVIILISYQCRTASSLIHPAAASSSSPLVPASHSVNSVHLQQARSRILLDKLIRVPSRLIAAQRTGQQVPAPLNFKRSGVEARSSLEQLSPKRFFDFLTDPSLLITVLHSLEVAYWTFPFGFVLTPVINFFRVPNRRSLQLSDRKKRSALNEDRLKLMHLRLLKSMIEAEAYSMDKKQKR